MGVYEGLTQIKPGMHWQQHPDRHQMLFTAYDPSRDLSPNLPTTSCESTVNLSSSAASRSASNSGCSTPINATRVGICCSYKEGYEPNEYSSKMPPSAGGDCQDCGRHPVMTGTFKRDAYGGNGNPRLSCKSESDSPVDYGCGADMYEFKKREYSQCIEPKLENPIGSPVDDDEAMKLCAGCGRHIADRFYLLAVDRRWHVTCLQCSQCARTLDKEATCFAKDGSIYCRKDYQRLFGVNRCSRCKATISSTELVMRAREYVFHVSCFFCVVCMTELRKGDHFGLRDGDVYCRLHYELLPHHPSDHNSPVPPPEDYHSPNSFVSAAIRGAPGALPTPSVALQTLPSPDFPSSEHRQHSLPPINSADGEKVTNSFYNGVSAPRPKGRPRKRKPKDLDSISNLDLNNDSYLDLTFSGGSSQHSLSGSNGSHHQRTKRMRTSFKHHQLRTMKTYFTINHNPDAKDLKQLSQKTGLAKRVLQVWFQNARAKWRRMINKQQENNGTNIKNMDEKSCSDNSSSALESVYHHGSMGLSNHSPQHYLSPTSVDCNSS